MASSVFICLGLGRPGLITMVIVSLPFVCAGQGAVGPPASAASLQEHYSPEREVRRCPRSASCSCAALRHADAADSSGRWTLSPGHKMAPMFLLFHMIISHRADTQTLTSASQMISSVQIMEFISKNCTIKCIAESNIRVFFLSHSF